MSSSRQVECVAMDAVDISPLPLCGRLYRAAAGAELINAGKLESHSDPRFTDGGVDHGPTVGGDL